nr:Dual specificity protein phosphatase 10 [Hymenolepis microstoma]
MFASHNATNGPIENVKDNSHPNKQTTKPIRDIDHIEHLTLSGIANPSSKLLLNSNRSKIPKLKIPTRTPVVFRSGSQENATLSQILDFLYLGNSRDARNFESLKKLGITHIINATRDLPNYVEDNGDIKYLRVAVEDSGTADLTPYFTPTIEFIDVTVRSQGRVLVHCQEGVSRSASLVVAYIMAHSNLSLMHALTVVSHARPIICPNINFLGQLDQFYQSIQHSNNTYFQSYPCVHHRVEQMIAKRFQDYQAEASRESTNINEEILSEYVSKNKES